MSKIYSDNGASLGLRTRLFRNIEGGVEWIYAVDYMAGDRRWFFYHPGVGRSVEDMIAKGIRLQPFDDGLSGRDEVFDLATASAELHPIIERCKP